MGHMEYSFMRASTLVTNAVVQLRASKPSKGAGAGAIFRDLSLHCKLPADLNDAKPDIIKTRARGENGAMGRAAPDGNAAPTASPQDVARTGRSS